MTAELDETPGQLDEHLVTIRLVGGSAEALPVVLDRFGIALVVVVDQPEESMGAGVGRGEPRRCLEMLDRRRDHPGVVIHRREEPMGIDRIGRGGQHLLQLPLRDGVEAQPVSGLAADEVDEAGQIGIGRPVGFSGERGEDIERGAREAAGDEETRLDDRSQPRGTTLPQPADRRAGRGGILTIDRLPGLPGKHLGRLGEGLGATPATLPERHGGHGHGRHGSKKPPDPTAGEAGAASGCWRHGAPPTGAASPPPGTAPASTMVRSCAARSTPTSWTMPDGQRMRSRCAGPTADAGRTTCSRRSLWER